MRLGPIRPASAVACRSPRTACMCWTRSGGPTPFDTGLIGFGGFVPRSLLERASIGPRIETTFGQSGFFGYGFCSADPDQGAMWWSTQPSHGIDAATYRAMDQASLRQHLR